MYEHLAPRSSSRSPLKLSPGLPVHDSFVDVMKQFEVSSTRMCDDAHDKLYNVNVSFGEIIDDLTEDEKNDLRVLNQELDSLSMILSDIADTFDTSMCPEIETINDADDLAFEYLHMVKSYKLFCEFHETFYTTLNHAKERINHA